MVWWHFINIVLLLHLHIGFRNDRHSGLEIGGFPATLVSRRMDSPQKALSCKCMASSNR